MFSRGEPDSMVQNVVQQCIRALDAAQPVLRPGARISDVAGVISEILEPIAPQGTIPYGHGIGMDNFEAPLLSVASDEVAQENMLIVIHPALVVEGQYFYLGDTYRVTKDGAERLSAYPLDLIVV
jgi:Xaa-Pro aminopeptidase